MISCSERMHAWRNWGHRACFPDGGHLGDPGDALCDQLIMGYSFSQAPSALADCAARRCSSIASASCAAFSSQVLDAPPPCPREAKPIWNAIESFSPLVLSATFDSAMYGRAAWIKSARRVQRQQQSAAPTEPWRSCDTRTSELMLNNCVRDALRHVVAVSTVRVAHLAQGQVRSQGLPSL